VTRNVLKLDTAQTQEDSQVKRIAAYYKTATLQLGGAAVCKVLPITASSTRTLHFRDNSA